MIVNETRRDNGARLNSNAPPSRGQPAGGRSGIRRIAALHPVAPPLPPPSPSSAAPGSEAQAAVSPSDAMDVY